MRYKGYNNSFNNWIEKVISIYKMNYFPETYSDGKNEIKFVLDIFRYAKKNDLKEVTRYNTDTIHKIFPKKIDLARFSYI